MIARRQLNGLFILHAHLQRIFVYDKVIATVPGNDPGPRPMPDLSSLIKRFRDALDDFDTDIGLPMSMAGEFETLSGILGKALAERVAHPDASLRDRLAVVSGDRFHDQCLFGGLVQWSNRYSPNAANFYTQQALSARSDTDTISALVSAATPYGILAPVDRIQLDAWYAVSLQVANRFESDIALAVDLLHGYAPR